jgi:tRNA threonylcarbamoyladenosine biosynthesis protein TsaB
VGGVIVLGIDTATNATSIALGSETGPIADLRFAGPRKQDDLLPAIERLLELSGLSLGQVGGIAVGIGPGSFTGLRVGVEVAKTLAQVEHLAIVGIASLDVLAFSVHTSRRLIAAVIDARRKEVFVGFYRSVPGGVVREGDYAVVAPEALAAELEARAEDVLMVGDGAILYRNVLERPGTRAVFAPATLGYPWASALVEVSVPRFIREETDRVTDVVPMYLRKTDAEIAWDHRARGPAPRG